MRAPIAVGGIALAVAAACSTYSEATMDSTGDASTSDASTSDAPTDASKAAPACPPNAFCDDFERDAGPALGWSTQTVDPENDLYITEDRRDAGGRALGVLLAPSANDGRFAYLEKNLTPSSASVRVTFAFNALAPPDTDVLIAMKFENSGMAYVLYRRDRLSIAGELPVDGGALEQEMVLDLLPTDTAWRDVSFQYTAGAPSKLALVVDSRQVQFDVQYLSGPIDRVLLGSTYGRKGSAGSLLFDDLKIETF